MRNFTRISGLITAVCVSFSGLNQACGQLTTIVDNLSQPTISSDDAAGTPYNNGWYAQGFTTPIGTPYFLEAVSLRLSREPAPDFSGTFTASLWDATAPGGIPQSNLGSIGTAAVGEVSAEVPSFVNYSFIPATSFTLNPSTTYFVVVEASASLANAGLYWALTDASNPASGVGTIGNWTTFGGTSWESFQITNTDLQLSVTATPVPEPAFYAFFAGTGLLGFVAVRSWRKRRS